MLPVIFCIATLSLIAGHAFAQDNGWQRLYRQAEAYYNSTNATANTNRAALQLYLRVISAIEKTAPIQRNPAIQSYPSTDSLLADSYLKTGILFLAADSPRQALPYFLHGTRTNVRGYKPPPAAVFQSLLYSGSCLYETYEMDSALAYYRLAEDMLPSHPGLGETQRLYNKMGVLFYEFGDYRRSIPYFTKALTLAEEQQGAGSFLAVNYRNNIATAWLKLEQYDKARDLFKQLLPFGKYRPGLYANIGSTLLDQGHPAEAIGWMHRSGLKTQVIYNNMAKCCLRLGRLDSARFFLHRSLDSRQNNTDITITWRLMGDLQLALGHIDSALSCYQEALVRACPGFSDRTIDHNPADFWGIRRSFDLFDLLLAKAGALRALGERSNNIGTFALSFSTYTSAIALARHVQRLYVSDDARLFLAEKADSAYKSAILLGYTLFLRNHDSSYLRKIFEYMEAGKSSVLQARLGEPGARALKGEQQRLVQQLNIARAEAVRWQIKNSANGSSETPAITYRLRELELSISSLQNRLERIPEYMSRKFATAPETVERLQQKLPAHAAFVSYYYADKKLFCFYTTPKNYGLAVVAWDPSNSVAIKDLRQQLNLADAGDQVLVENSAHRLSDVVIAPVYPAIRSFNRWIIAPYNELSCLPFELLTAPGDSRPLVYRYALSYSYSANIGSFAGDSARAGYRILAVAPFASAAGGMPALPASVAEVKGLPGKTFINEAASARALMQEIPEYPIIHFATHAVANDEEPARSFIALRADPNSSKPSIVDRLYEQSICELDLARTRLVFLSACETGTGPLIHGEGVISLARAFQYAGCNSIITSLWKADDRASSFIARRVYDHLRDGSSRDEALQQAKLDYLNDESIDQRYKLPAYWAHFVLIGAPGPLVAEKRRPWSYLLMWCAAIGVVGAISTIGLLIWKKAGRSQSARPGSGFRGEA